MDFYIRNGQQMNFQVGQTIQIRDWNEMAEEFETKDRSDMTIIYCKSHFTSEMMHLCGAIATITNINGMIVKLKFNRKFTKSTDWYYSLDMIKPIEEIKK